MKLIILLSLSTVLFAASCKDSNTDPAESTCKYIGLWLSDCGGHCSEGDDCIGRYNALEKDEQDFWYSYSRILYNDKHMCPPYSAGDFYLDMAIESLGVSCNYYCGDGVCPKNNDKPDEYEDLVTCPEDCAIRLCGIYSYWAEEHSCADTSLYTCQIPDTCVEDLFSIATTSATPLLLSLDDCFMDMVFAEISECRIYSSVDGTPCDEYVNNYIPLNCNN